MAVSTDNALVQDAHQKLDEAYYAFYRNDENIHSYVTIAIESAVNAGIIEAVAELLKALEEKGISIENTESDKEVQYEESENEDENAEEYDEYEEYDDTEDYCKCGKFHYQCVCKDIHKMNDLVNEDYDEEYDGIFSSW